MESLHQLHFRVQNNVLTQREADLIERPVNFRSISLHSFFDTQDQSVASNHWKEKTLPRVTSACNLSNTTFMSNTRLEKERKCQPGQSSFQTRFQISLVCEGSESGLQNTDNLDIIIWIRSLQNDNTPQTQEQHKNTYFSHRKASVFWLKQEQNRQVQVLLVCRKTGLQRRQLTFCSSQNLQWNVTGIRTCVEARAGALVCVPSFPTLLETKPVQKECFSSSDWPPHLYFQRRFSALSCSTNQSHQRRILRMNSATRLHRRIQC